uniref:Protease m50 membrane-bound transcription factor site 2 protease n=1 Tax=Solanum tuberosum TaxID=4113 RepID=M1BEX0_SOLTU
MDWSTSEDPAGTISQIFSAPCQDPRPVLLFYGLWIANSGHFLSFSMFWPF